MPTPVAKGIIITVSALVAAGIAVYESPQFRQWVNNSRRKIAVALHNLGDEIHPQDAAPYRQDISMTEEVGAAAEERRRIAVEELQRRRSLLEARRNPRESTPASSFDSLVDESGRLLDVSEPHANDSLANSTAVELTTSQPVQRGKPAGNSSAMVDSDGIKSLGPDRLQISIPSPDARTPSLVEFTPTSEVPDRLEASFISQSEDGERSVGSAGPSTRPESAATSHTEDFSEVLYAHPDDHANDTTANAYPDANPANNPFDDFDHYRPSTPSTPSVASSFSQIHGSAADTSSEGTLSEFERSGAATPASWSEVGSVISNEEHHYL
ncbi:hypothetical protein BO70DRAFT_363376 [Aspergillus heteromorphus CBS 117.55]|uniref:Uncharacterized protein n=1 Tax=Aspergillus heteromorphus CBS 117.55 TaxID=1448321 RepID=A0A317VUA9_9EURO|nr:uncharacterized protein BO70DRAFT_363376 [Aspergillus heteromorphus CBS 117.55]PWY77445.1 hypothetical protein BO70DRAFT_363376 [Aspergillus heteromorphus CBS 117.55]